MTEHHEHHGHENDQGWRGALRYLRWAPSMWRSEINRAVIDMVGPQDGERVVDVGAGMGAGATVALRSGATVVAVEPTPFMRRILAARRWLQRGRARLDVVDGTAESMPIDDHSVDAVWAVNTMHHWVDPERGAGEIARVLRPGGRFVLVDEDFTDPTHPEHERFGAANGDHHRTHDDHHDEHGGHDHHDEHGGHDHHGFTMVEAERMGELLVAAGLSDVDAADRVIAGRPSITVTGRA